MNKLFLYAAGSVFFGAVLCVSVDRGPLQAQPLDPVRIAVVIALTGIAAEDNLPAVKAARLAVEKVNGSGGILGSPVELVFIDNRSTPIGSKHASKLAVKAGVVGVIGPFWSSHAMPAAAVLQEARVPMITPTATKPVWGETVGERICDSMPEAPLWGPTTPLITTLMSLLKKARLCSSCIYRGSIRRGLLI